MMIRTALTLAILAITASELVESRDLTRLRAKRDAYLIPPNNAGGGGYGRPPPYVHLPGSYPTPGQGGYPVPGYQGQGGYPVPGNYQGQGGGYPAIPAGSFNQGPGSIIPQPGSFVQVPGQGGQNGNVAPNNGWGTGPFNNGENTNQGSNSGTNSGNPDGNTSIGLPRGSVEGIAEIIDATGEPDIFGVTGEIVPTETTTSLAVTVVPENVNGELVPTDNSTTTEAPTAIEEFSTTTVETFSTEGVSSTEGFTATDGSSFTDGFSSTTTLSPFAPEEVSSTTTVGPFSTEVFSSTTSSFSTEGVSSTTEFPVNIDASSTEGVSTTTSAPIAPEASSTEGFSTSTEGSSTTSAWQKTESPSFPGGQPTNDPFSITVLPGMPGEMPSSEFPTSTEGFSSSTVAGAIDGSSTTQGFPFSGFTGLQTAGPIAPGSFGIETASTANPDLNLASSTTEATPEGFFNNWGNSNGSNSNTGNNFGSNSGSSSGNVGESESNRCNCSVTGTSFDTCSCSFTSSSVNGTLGVGELPTGSEIPNGNTNSNFGGSNQGVDSNQGIQGSISTPPGNVFSKETTTVDFNLQGITSKGDGTFTIPENQVIGGSGAGEANETTISGSENGLGHDENGVSGHALALKDNKDDTKFNSAPMSSISYCSFVISMFTVAIVSRL